MISDRNINQQHQYWDSLSSEATFTHPLNLKIIRKYLSSEKPMLDYGCGYGRICQELWQNGYKNVLGVDISGKMIGRGNKLYPHLTLINLDSRMFWRESNRFDLVILFSVLTCIPENQALQDLMRHIQHVLTPGGYLYISDTLVQTDRRNVKRYEKFYERYGTYGIFRLPEGGIFRHFRMDDILSLTTQFKGISSYIIDVITLNNHPAKGFQYFCKKES